MLNTFKTSEGGKFNLNNLNVQATFQDKYQDARQANTINKLCDYYKGTKMQNARLTTKKSLSDARRKNNFKLG